MIKLGSINRLKLVRETSSGMYLSNQEGNAILLPYKYAPDNAKVGDALDVFCYMDNEGRPIATTLEPTIILGEFQLLRVAEVGEFGAFLDWGIEKHLLAPFAEQRPKMQDGHWYVVHCYLDSMSNRLVASSNVEKFLSKETPIYENGEEVEVLVHRKTPLGWQVIIENQHEGLVYDNEVFKELRPGDWHRAVVKRVRPDGKVDISLQPLGEKILEPAAKKIYASITDNDGFLPLNDKSSPESIKKALQMSKKTFKKGVGHLYKQRKIILLDNGIQIAK